jgi:hypothetical protein
MNNTQVSKLSSLSYYHPIRYAIARNSFIDEVIKTLPASYNLEGDFIFNFSLDKYQESYSRFVDGWASHSKLSLAKDLLPTATRRLYTAINQMYLKGKHKERESLLEYLLTAIDDDYRIFKQYALLICYHNNIFDFDSELLKMFESTDVDNVLLKDIHLPFPTTYLHFGKQSNKNINGDISSLIDAFTITNKIPGFKKDVDFFLDGAYISQCSNTGKLIITLTSVKSRSNKYINNCIDCYEDTFKLDLVKISEYTTVQEAVELERENLFSFHKNDWIEQYLKNEFTDSLESDLNHVKLTNDKKINSVIKSLKLVINCLLYLQSYPEEVEEDYPLENLERAATKTNGFGKAVAQKEVSKSQYRKIKFCGRKKKSFKPIQEETICEEINLLDANLSDESKRSLPPHRRRAHPRKQRYGKGLEQWRYVWIKETTIHKDKYQHSSDNYRIYEVEAPSTIVCEV